MQGISEIYTMGGAAEYAFFYTILQKDWRWVNSNVGFLIFYASLTILAEAGIMSGLNGFLAQSATFREWVWATFKCAIHD